MNIEDIKTYFSDIGVNTYYDVQKYISELEQAITNYNYNDNVTKIEKYLRRFTMNVCRYDNYHHHLFNGCKCVKQMKNELEIAYTFLNSIDKDRYG